jgi:hypothetical protein
MWGGLLLADTLFKVMKDSPLEPGQFLEQY